MLQFLLVLLLPFAALTQNANPAPAHHELREVKFDDQILFGMIKGKEFSLPQMWVYDRQGRQVADFGDGFDPDGFRPQLEKVLHSPSPKADGKSLEAVVKDFVEKDGKPLRKLADADFTIVEYWAEWCEACHDQAKLLNEVVSAQTDLNITVFHVEADPEKIRLPGVVMEKK